MDFELSKYHYQKDDFMPFVDDAAKLSVRNTALRQDSGLDRPGSHPPCSPTLRESFAHKDALSALALATFGRLQFGGGPLFYKMLTGL